MAHDVVTTVEHKVLPPPTGKVAGKVFRIGHLGDFNDLMLAGTLAGVEMGLELANVPHKKGGIATAMDYLVLTKAPGAKQPAAKLSVA